MRTALFPRRPTDAYEGHNAALWILALIVLVELLIGVRSIFTPEAVATAADGIPLAAYPPAAARTVVSLFALLGMSRLLLALLGLLVLLSYRAFVPLTFTLLLLDALCRRLILRFHPIPRAGGAGGWVVTLVLLGLMAAGLALALWRRSGEPAVREGG
ncbi:MAG TPA: hypothetical protein VKA44_00760 [Gemmatimonadota bacterium]|nr:hypothetical protein [Gemmatimonadota bacterium]